jgi:hypothetical protein
VPSDAKGFLIEDPSGPPAEKVNEALPPVPNIEPVVWDGAGWDTAGV